MKKILVAGGAGFLGSHLCEHFLTDDYVVCIDNFSTGRQQNIEHLIKNPNFELYQIDICQEIPDKIAKQNFDVIINMASPASPPKYQALPVETLMVGALGTKNLLEIAKKHGARFFHASTSEVYGDPEVHPQTEAYKGSVNCYGPRSMYDEAKRFAEALIYVYRKEYQVNTVIARFFNTYGPNMDPGDGRVVSNFITQALGNQPITIYGDGQQTRSFCYVSDLVEAISKLIDSDVEGPINLGNTAEFTVKELAELVKQKIPLSTSKIIYKKLPTDDPMQRRPDITYAKKILQWQPKVKLEEGLIHTIRYFKSIMPTSQGTHHNHFS